MAKVKIKLNRKAVREQLLKSPEMAAICKDYADAMAARCGEGYAADVHTGKNRVNASVYPATQAAAKDNLKNNTIIKAVRG